MASNYSLDDKYGGDKITPPMATKLLRRHYNPLVNVTDVRKLYGGNINRVLEFVLDRDPGSVVVKIHANDGTCNFATEFESLQLFRRETHFPVPQPYAYIANDPEFDASLLIIQKINGTPLESSKISAAGKRVFETELAQAMAELHRHKAERFGKATSSQTHDNWIEMLRPIVEKTFAQARADLPASTREVMDHVQQHLHRWLDIRTQPTLIHGDLWANNILIDDSHPDHPRILSFIDGHASYADPEYELAYLQLFGTGGKTFFDVYSRIHPIAPGYRRRSRVYWLITMLQNASRFGDRYVPYCDKIARDLRHLTR